MLENFMLTVNNPTMLKLNYEQHYIYSGLPFHKRIRDKCDVERHFVMVLLCR